MGSNSGVSRVPSSLMLTRVGIMIRRMAKRDFTPSLTLG